MIFLLSSGIWETIIRKEMERRERGEEREHIEFQQQREGRKGDAAPFKPLLKFEPCLLCCTECASIVSIASSAKGGIVLASREQKFHFDSQWGFDSFPFLFSEASLHLRNEPFSFGRPLKRSFFFSQRQQRRPKNAAENKNLRGGIIPRGTFPLQKRERKAKTPILTFLFLRKQQRSLKMLSLEKTARSICEIQVLTSTFSTEKTEKIGRNSSSSFLGSRPNPPTSANTFRSI